MYNNQPTPALSKHQHTTPASTKTHLSTNHRHPYLNTTQPTVYPTIKSKILSLFLCYMIDPIIYYYPNKTSLFSAGKSIIRLFLCLCESPKYRLRQMKISFVFTSEQNNHNKPVFCTNTRPMREPFTNPTDQSPNYD